MVVADYQTMEDFEYAVESATLPSFLKQDVDLDLSSGNKSATIGEAELEALMREMSEGDLEKLAGEIGIDTNDTKVGLIKSPEPSVPTPLTTQSPTTVETPSNKGTASGGDPPVSASSRKESLVGGVLPEKKGSRASMEEKADLAREMMTTGTIDGLLKAVEKAEGKEKLD